MNPRLALIALAVFAALGLAGCEKLDRAELLAACPHGGYLWGDQHGHLWFGDSSGLAPVSPSAKRSEVCR